MRASSPSVRPIDPFDLAAVPDMPLALADDTCIPLALIDSAPNNPRIRLADVEALAGSIERFGLLQPVAVRKIGCRYELIGGARRVAAFRLLLEHHEGAPCWASIPAVVRRANDDVAYLAAIAMHAHTKAWTVREEARALERLASGGRTQQQIAVVLSKTVGWVSKRLRLYSDLVLSGYVQSGQLAPSVAEEMLPVRDAATRSDMAQRAVDERWSQTDARAVIRRLRTSDQMRDIQRRIKELTELLFWADGRTLPPPTIEVLQLLARRIDEVIGKPREAGTAA